MTSDTNLGANGGGAQQQNTGNGAADDVIFGPAREQPDALSAYAKRINAERRNFRRYVIKEQQRELYHLDRYIITIDDGEVDIRDVLGSEIPDDADILPTPEEEEAIKEQCTAADWPKSTHASEDDFEKLKLRAEVGRDAILFKFYDQNDHQRILFVQQRIFRKDAAKLDLPWSFWSDSEWRRMEPDYEKLPLFGLEELKHKNLTTVFVHEGAKTAWFLQQNDAVKAKWWRAHAATEGEWSDRCPWAKELASYQGRQTAHVGWPGGAPNPHRVDWEPLKRLPPHVHVIVVADHDPAGENAVSKISYALQRRMQVLRFGEDFPRKFDLSDPFPEELYESNDEGVRVYKRTAPRLEQCLEPATWATTADSRLRAEFIEEWLYTVQPAYFLHRADLSRHYSEKEFNALIAPFAHPWVPNVGALLHKNYSAQGQMVIYAPDRQPGRINYNGMQVVNVYRPSPIRPQPGDAAPWLEFMSYLVPDETDRQETLRWCATLIARAEIRMTYSVLMVSETQGVGKTTLAEILAQLVGEHNCSFPSAETITDSNFNSWVAYKRLAVVAEIYAGHSTKTFNKLKAIVSDKYIYLNEKYEKEHWIDNWVHIFATSNSYNALKIDDQDRRWFVPGVTEVKRPLEYFIRLRKWLDNGGYEIIGSWAQGYNDYVATGAHAPTSAAKRKAIEEGYVEGERLVLEFGRALKQREQQTVVRQDRIRDWLASSKAAANHSRYGSDGRQFLETPRKIAAILQQGCELYLPGKRFEDEDGKFRVVANFEVPEAATWGDLKGCCVEPRTVRQEQAM